MLLPVHYPATQITQQAGLPPCVVLSAVKTVICGETNVLVWLVKVEQNPLHANTTGFSVITMVIA